MRDRHGSLKKLGGKVDDIEMSESWRVHYIKFEGFRCILGGVLLDLPLDSRMVSPDYSRCYPRPVVTFFRGDQHYWQGGRLRRGQRASEGD